MPDHTEDNSAKKVSKKKIIFVQIDEEITGIFERVQKLPYKEVYLVVPKRAALLQSVVNLKILKQKFDEIDKTLAIITNDQNGMKLAQLSEIKVFDHWQNGEKNGGENKEETTLLKPIAATSNEVEEEAPSRLPQKKSSIFEVVRDLKSGDKGFSLKTYLKDRKANKAYSLNLNMPTSTKKFIGGLLVLSIAVFLIIAYVALPGAVINIVPASAVITKASNIALESNPTDSRSLKSYPIEASVDLTYTHHASGTKSQGANSTGTITIYNENNKEQQLVAQTRFESPEGIIFRIQKEVFVPAGSSTAPGQLEATVVADTVDANNVAVGERGNIGPSKFFVVALNEENRKKVYAESFEYMTGGVTDVNSYVVDEDLTAAGQKLEEQLKEKAISALRKEALAQGNALSKNLVLLEDSDVIEYGTAKITFPTNLIGQEMETFDVSGKMTISGVAYDSEALLSILKSEIFASKTPGKQLVKIDENSISISVFEVGTSYIKFTAQIQGIEEYEIDPELEGGSKLAKKIKEHVAGKTKEEAEAYIQNLPEVNSVEINIWPVWSPTIPSLPDNIKIKSLSDADVIAVESEE
jgi:hypothetical protein